MASSLLLSLLLLSVGVVSKSVSEPTSRQAPNIIFFMADDTGWNNVEGHNTPGEGSGMITPHSHALLRDGIELDRHYVFQVCSPSRSSFMSGRYPHHVQQINYRNCDTAQGIPRNMTAIARKLKESPAQYATVHVGKWHLGMSSVGHTPKGRGFDKSLVYFEGAQDHWTQRSCCDPECIAPINATTKCSAYTTVCVSASYRWKRKVIMPPRKLRLSLREKPVALPKSSHERHMSVPL